MSWYKTQHARNEVILFNTLMLGLVKFPFSSSYSLKIQHQLSPVFNMGIYATKRIFHESDRMYTRRRWGIKNISKRTVIISEKHLNFPILQVHF